MDLPAKAPEFTMEGGRHAEPLPPELDTRVEFCCGHLQSELTDGRSLSVFLFLFVTLPFKKLKWILKKKKEYNCGKNKMSEGQILC